MKNIVHEDSDDDDSTISKKKPSIAEAVNAIGVVRNFVFSRTQYKN